MANTYDLRERAVDARSLLNSFLLDLAVGTRGLDIFDLPYNCAQRKSQDGDWPAPHGNLSSSRSPGEVDRVLPDYWTILPPDARDACLALHHQHHCRGIVDFRDTVVGHILDNDTKRPFNVGRDR